MASSSNAPSLAPRGCSAGRRDAFHLPARRTSVPEARRRVTALLRSWGTAPGVRDDVELVVCELFTNALRHTASRWVGCELSLHTGYVRIAVTDEGGAGASAPRVRPGSVDKECGRGLFLVGALARNWGTRPDEHGGGRVVWAEVGREGATD
ncbi:ATP-binding protein [Streptomyces catenulae]|uniref:ATP-binding protein n=1 Tax=Streptomyces catenulae TaxID=66875 RepID=A0ABV2Z5B3_9ACTN|nr:ATP-binding protein [Streptomyces catenulae]